MTGMASHWMELALVLILLTLFLSPLMLIYTGYFRAVKADERDIRDHGIATQGRVVAIHYRQKWPTLAVIDELVR